MRSGWHLALAALAWMVQGCIAAPAFHCGQDAECQAGGRAGRCEPLAGVCSFADESCASGWRYGAYAGEPSGTCVAPSGTDAGSDAPAADGPADARAADGAQ